VRQSDKILLFILRCSLCLIFSCLIFSSFAFSEPLSLQIAKNAFDRGDFTTAYKVLHTLVLQHPGDPENDFLLGRSAYEIGDYEAAIFAFERVLIADPEADRVRLELARSYFEIGDLESARNNFNRVLNHHPPLTVRQNIERYLERLEQASRKHNLSGSLTMSLSYEDNVYASPVDEQIGTILGNVTLTGNGATPQEDVVNRNSLLLNHLYRRHPKEVGWLTSLQAHSSLYSSEEDLNLNLVGLVSGPVWQQGKQLTKLQANFTYLTLNEERYLSIGGVSVEHSRQLGKNFSATLAAQLSRLNYASNGRDASQIRLELKPSWQLTAGTLLAGIGLEGNRSKQNEYSYLRTIFQLRYQQPILWKFAGLLGIRLQETDYEGVIPLFNRARIDRLRELTLGLSRPVWQDAVTGQRMQAQLLGTFTKVNSNIDLYEYDKQVFSFALSYLF